ncbi:MAG TPA: hypothetical protein VF020_18795 [Chthoniobacterales bacterium]
MHNSHDGLGLKTRRAGVYRCAPRVDAGKALQQLRSDRRDARDLGAFNTLDGNVA